MTDSPAKIESLARDADVVIIGAGVVGLWCALRASEAGMKALVIEPGKAGEGASHGHLGALMPHQPVNWSPKKQEQLDGLLELEQEVARLETLTGLSAGYRRTGRIVPLTDAAQRERNEAWAVDARQVWPAHAPGGQHLAWRVMDTNPAPGWICSEAAPFGFAVETLSARLAPRRMMTLLRAALQDVPVMENCPAGRVSPDGTIHLTDGTSLRPRRVILAAGWRSFALMPGLAAMPRGSGVKGQSALLRPRAPVDPRLPVLYADGVYAIAHEDGLVAVGSTSEKQWVDDAMTDHRLDELVAKAKTLCPALRGAEIIDRWAGIRPKGPTAAPVVGPLAGAPSVILATGGFKITFALAHRMARAAVTAALT
ncbi:MAG: FAD-binding oxidoreductase [Notoacmeibacter sp.]|nr:FAD-binding oxidoreductase [Notoacmeibacter sp.]MCC0031740.1 FAD-binding oxidoreductase [Brucellaceae bacterium]